MHMAPDDWDALKDAALLGGVAAGSIALAFTVDWLARLLQRRIRRHR